MWQRSDNHRRRCSSIAVQLWALPPQPATGSPSQLRSSPVAVQDTSSEDIALAVASFSAWLYLAWFLLAFELTGPFIITTYRMMTFDIPAFLVVVSIFMGAFVSSLYVLSSKRGVGFFFEDFWVCLRALLDDFDWSHFESTVQVWRARSGVAWARQGKFRCLEKWRNFPPGKIFAACDQYFTVNPAAGEYCEFRHVQLFTRRREGIKMCPLPSPPGNNSKLQDSWRWRIFLF